MSPEEFAAGATPVGYDAGMSCSVFALYGTTYQSRCYGAPANPH
jgi:hypothetical protein